MRSRLKSKVEWQKQGWRIAQSCVHYIGLPVFRKEGWCPWHIYQQTVFRWPFVRYAVAHRHHHYRDHEALIQDDAESVQRSSRLFQSALRFVGRPQSIDFVSLVMVQLERLRYPMEAPTIWYDHIRPYGLNGLLMASMPKLVDKLLEKANLQTTSQATINSETAAYLAAIFGDVETPRIIVRRGLGNKTLNIRDTEGFPVICRAMFCGNIAIVRELLNDSSYSVELELLSNAKSWMMNTAF
ncbi:hypothetical protein CERZMDRAFT_100214 [Cercospora zeae-maydis SCOH1-5]|uniref:Uncharacterized protein n=1 Tax=Cercospora zeae-maydis SCOH1-5 TaxID=717836 RepID=A0A6A6F8U5_9PEZI|nr:hypothetical protein CERZMDRAFT_100214 [Cercospora zeae-maydis SCOH1-5]